MRKLYRYFLAVLIGIMCATAATYPTSRPAHYGGTQEYLLGWIADNTQMTAQGTGVATYPTSRPAHYGATQEYLLGYIADNTQDIANNTARIFRPETYGAIADDAGDDKAGIQAAIDAAIAAGGGIVQLSAGLYKVNPAATGLAILTDGDYVLLRGAGEGTEIEFSATGASAVFCGIAGKRYNTCTAPYTAAPVWVEDMRLTCDSSTDTDMHDLIGICHAPWALVRRVGFEQAYYHAFEINVSKNVLVEDCYTYGTGNFASCIIELDGLGAAGQIAGGGTHSQSTPLENITIRRFIQRVPRTDMTLDPTYCFMLLSHTNSNNVLRNVTIEDCVIIPHRNATVAPGTTRAAVAFDSAAWPLTVDGLTIRNNIWADTGGITGSTILLDLSTASTATRNVRNVVVEGNRFYSPHGYAVKVGVTGSATTPRTSITDAILRSHDGIVLRNNMLAVNLYSNTGASARATRSIWVGSARSVTVDNNVVTWPDNALGNWGTSTTGSSNFAFFIDHPQNLVLTNNTVEITRPQSGGTGGVACYVCAFAFGAGAYEIQTALSGHWQVTGNKAVGNGNIGNNLAVGFLGLFGAGTEIGSWTTANKSNPRIKGYWSGNWSLQTGTGTFTHTLQATYADYYVTAASITTSAQTEAQLATMGGHDWYPQAGEVGTVVTVPAGATMAPGWALYNGAATTTLDWIKESRWNQALGLSGTANLPSTANTYIRLSGN